jgi:hypothetical protein
MLYSELSNKKELYISFHCEQVYQDFDNYEKSSINNGYLGYFSTELEIETIERVKRHINNIDTSKINHIIIDCDRITESRNPDSEFSEIIDIVNSKKLALSILRIGVKLYSDLKIKHYKQKLGKSVIEDDTLVYTNFYINSKVKKRTKQFDNRIFKLYENILKGKIKKKYLVNNKKGYSDSSNVYLPKYINIKHFIEENKITYFGLYLLCKKAINTKLIPEFNEREKSSKTKLFFQSINGAYISSIISKIALLDMAFIDHIGPINKIYRTILKNNFNEQDSYLIVSDVICMGTETEIAKSLIYYENSKVRGNLTIVKVEPVYKEKNDNIQTCSLFTLTKENNTEIQYEITTDFEKK